MRMSQKLDRRGELACSFQHISICTTSVEGGIAESMKFPCAHKSPVPKLSRVHTFILDTWGFLQGCTHQGTRRLGPKAGGDFWLHPPLAFRTERHHQCVVRADRVGGHPG